MPEKLRLGAEVTELPYRLSMCYDGSRDGSTPPPSPSRGAFLEPAYTALTLLPTASRSMTLYVLIIAISVGICSTAQERELGFTKIVTVLTGAASRSRSPSLHYPRCVRAPLDVLMWITD